MNAELIHLILKILLVLGLVAVNGFFVAAEFALVKIRETELDALVLKGNRHAKVARSIIANLNSFLSATQIGVTMASLGLGWIGQPVFSALFWPLLSALHIQPEALRHSISFALGFFALTFLHISAGELAPKWTAIQSPLPIALWVAQPLKWFYLASYPFNWLPGRHRGGQRSQADPLGGGTAPAGGRRPKTGRRHRAGPGDRP
jgi:CBS domain containing-hemolysin-like protein